MQPSDNHIFDELDEDVESRLLSFYENPDSTSKTQKLPKYLINELRSGRSSIEKISLHSEGGSKKIYKIHDTRTGRDIALAKLKNDATSQQMERFLNEARITASLEHPNIIPIYDIGLDEKQEPFFLMKFLKDQSLEKILKELKKGNPEFQYKYSLNILLDIYIKVCEAVDYAHSQDVIHLDLKPDNIMIGDYGEVYVCDWGIARILQANNEGMNTISLLEIDMVNDFTLSGMIKGTPGFMAPEQINSRFGKKGKRTDIYALGAILYAILTLHKPLFSFKGKQILEATINGRLKEPKAIKSSIPKSLNAVVMKAMSKKKHNRYAKVNEIIAEIRSFELGYATAAESVSFLKRLFLLIRRRKTETVFSFLIISIVCSSFAMLQKRASEMKATLNLYEHEKEIRREQLLKSTPALLNQWWRNIAVMDSDFLHSQLDELSDIDPNNDRVKFFDAMLYLIELNFEKAEQIVNTTKRPNFSEEALRISQIIALCRSDLRNYKYIKNSTALHCLEVRNFGEYHATNARFFLGSIFSQLKSDKEKSSLTKSALKYWVQEQPKLKSSFITTSRGWVKADLRELNMPTILGLEFFPFDELDLTNSLIRYYPRSGSKHIKFLNLSGCVKLDSLSGLRNCPNLKRVILPAKKRGSSIANYLEVNGVKVEFSEK